MRSEKGGKELFKSYIRWRERKEKGALTWAASWNLKGCQKRVEGGLPVQKNTCAMSAVLWKGKKPSK